MKVTRFLYNLKLQEKEEIDARIEELTEAINKEVEKGDLKENSEYDIAMSDRRLAMSTKQELVQFLEDAEIIENTGLEDSTRIILGSILKLTYVVNDKTYEKIVLFDGIENYLAGIISPESNLGKKINGMDASTPINVKVETPIGTIVNYKVEKLKNCNEYDLYAKSNPGLKTKLAILFDGIGKDSTDKESIINEEVNPDEVSKALQGY